MGLLEEASQARDAKLRSRKCKVQAIAEALPPKDRDDLGSLLADPAFTNVLIASVLGKRGHRISDHTVGIHRRGQCGCAD